MSDGNDRWFEGLRIGTEEERRRIREGATLRVEPLLWEICNMQVFDYEVNRMGFAVRIVEAVLGKE